MGSPIAGAALGTLPGAVDPDPISGWALNGIVGAKASGGGPGYYNQLGLQNAPTPGATAQGNPYGTTAAGTTYQPGQYGNLGVPKQVAPNLGQPTAENNLMMDMGDSLMGHASYANGGQFGAGSAADNYAMGASQMGSAIGQANAAQGNAIASSLAGQGGGYGGALMAIGNNAAGQQAQTADYSGAQGGLNAQNNALSLYQQAAQGNGPSAAQAQLQQGVDASIAAQQATANSARGGFGLANAQKDAAANAGQAQAQAANAAAQLRAQEQQAGMAGYATLGGTVQQQQAANAQFNAQQRQQQQQANIGNQLAAFQSAAGQNLGYQNAAQQAAYGWTGMGLQNQLAYNQLGQQTMGQQLSADVANQQSTNQQASANAGRQQQGMGSIVSMIGSLFGGM